jgi:peptidoglycan/LPS O-acetylase OafA/YrhL
VLVVLHHVALRIPLKRGVLADLVPRWILDALAYNGYEAVFVFFVVSGFLIATHSVARWGRLGAIDARAFYVRRAARILPCLVLLVGVLAALHLAGAADYRITRPDQSLGRAVLSALGLHLNWYEGHTGYLPASWDVLWSLSIEEVFYLGFPLLCLTLRRDWALGPVLGLLALSLPVTRAALEGNEIWQEKAYLPGMAGIAAGVLAALLAARVRRPRPRAVWLLGAAGAAGLFAVLCFEGKLWPWIGNGAVLLLTSSAACLVLAFHWRALDGGDRAIPGTGWLRSFGRSS